MVELEYEQIKAAASQFNFENNENMEGISTISQSRTDIVDDYS